jgi:hypothetical protein
MEISRTITLRVTINVEGEVTDETVVQSVRDALSHRYATEGFSDFTDDGFCRDDFTVTQEV